MEKKYWNFYLMINIPDIGAYSWPWLVLIKYKNKIRLKIKYREDVL